MLNKKIKTVKVKISIPSAYWILILLHSYKIRIILNYSLILLMMLKNIYYSTKVSIKTSKCCQKYDQMKLRLLYPYRTHKLRALIMVTEDQEILSELVG